MCLFLEMLRVKKCHDLRGGKYFRITVNIFPDVGNLELPFCSTAIVDKIIRGNVIYIIYFISS